MKTDAKRKIISLIITALIFAGFFILSRTVLNDIYLYNWTAGYNYIVSYIAPFAVSAALILFGKFTASYFITAGNFLGMIFGQLIGDLIIERNSLKITSGMSQNDPEGYYRLTYHYGVFIWIAVLLIFAAAGIILNVILGKRRGA